MKTNEERLNFIKSLPTEPKTAKVTYYDEDGDIQTGDAGWWWGNEGTYIGKDGFGYEWDGERYVKFPHRGDVKIGKDVEIGSNTCIDRATLEGEATEIGDGTKIDNLVHIAHNVKIGKHCLIVAGSIIGGSVTIGDRCYIGIGAMVKNKVKIGNDVTVGMGAVVLKDIPDGETWVGNPAKQLVKVEIVDSSIFNLIICDCGMAYKVQKIQAWEVCPKCNTININPDFK